MLLDKDIREPLFEFLEERYGKVRILEEKTVGSSRADVVMVIPDKIVGIEIKSDADTYTRLERQVADYDLWWEAHTQVMWLSMCRTIGGSYLLKNMIRAASQMQAKMQMRIWVAKQLVEAQLIHLIK